MTIVFGFLIADKARFIVAIGVLNSCVMLLIKSVFICEICLCLSNNRIVVMYAIIIIVVKITEVIITESKDDNKKGVLPGKVTFKE